MMTPTSPSPHRKAVSVWCAYHAANTASLIAGHGLMTGEDRVGAPRASTQLSPYLQLRRDGQGRYDSGTALNRSTSRMLMGIVPDAFMASAPKACWPPA